MNNCIERKNDRIYNEAPAEKVIAFVCLIIAFFENTMVETICRFIGAVIVALSMFFYVSALMAGSLGILEIAVFGGVIIAVCALIFKVKIARS